MDKEVTTKPRDHDKHQEMLRQHLDDKQDRRERHRLTRGKVRKYCGNLY